MILPVISVRRFITMRSRALSILTKILILWFLFCLSAHGDDISVDKKYEVSGYGVPRASGEGDLATENTRVKKHGMPRVLLIGDSVAVAYAPYVRKDLEQCAQVELIKENAGNTRNGVYQLQKWLGDGGWDIIHFNFGLHDLLYVSKDAAHGPNIDINEYEQNLVRIIKRLKKKNQGVKLIFATTTPVPVDDPKRNYADVVAYNVAAINIMKEMDVSVDDLYSGLLPYIKEMRIPGSVHVNNVGARHLAYLVITSIKSRLKEAGVICSAG